MTIKRENRAKGILISIAIAVAVLAAFTVPFLPEVRAANHSVSIANFAFSPSSVTVSPGDNVTWTNNDGVTHTVTGTGWGSGSIAPGGTYTHQFNTSGDFSYHCSIHPSMTGTVHVSSGTNAGPPAPSSKPFLSGWTLIAVILIIVALVAVVAAVFLMRKPAPPSKT